MTRQIKKHLLRQGWIYFFLLIMGLSGGACEGETDQRYRLTSFERRRLDTLYDQALDSIRPRLDSICDYTYENNMQYTIDSLVRQGRQEAAALRRRNPIEQ